MLNGYQALVMYQYDISVSTENPEAHEQVATQASRHALVLCTVRRDTYYSSNISSE